MKINNVVQVVSYIHM